MATPNIQASLDAELALPMSHRGDLDGFVLLRSKRNHEGYRPDEIEVLGFAAHQVGLDLHALENEALQARNEELEMALLAKDEVLNTNAEVLKAKDEALQLALASIRGSTLRSAIE